MQSKATVHLHEPPRAQCVLADCSRSGKNTTAQAGGSRVDKSSAAAKGIPAAAGHCNRAAHHKGNIHGGHQRMFSNMMLLEWSVRCNLQLSISRQIQNSCAVAIRLWLHQRFQLGHVSVAWLAFSAIAFVQLLMQVIGHNQPVHNQPAMCGTTLQTDTNQQTSKPPDPVLANQTRWMVI